ALDVQTRNLMENELLDLWAETRNTVLFITHDLEEAIALSDEVIVLTAGPGRVKASYPIPLPRPRNVIGIRFREEFTRLHAQIWATVQEAVVGLAVGIVGGVLVGMLFAFFPFLSGLFHPLMVIFNATPRIALAPLFIVWLGIGLASKVAMVVSLVFFIIFFSTYAGLREVDVNLINHVRVMGGSRGDLVRHVLFPSALTWIFASLRTCVGFAVIGAILGEYLGADRGIGWIVQYGESLFNSNM